MEKTRHVSKLETISLLALVLSLGSAIYFTWALDGGRLAAFEDMHRILSVTYIFLCIAFLLNLFWALGIFLDKASAAFQVFLGILAALFLIFAAMPVGSLWNALFVNAYALIRLSENPTFLFSWIGFLFAGGLALFFRILYHIFFKD